jgi:hypothetical protein
MEWRDVEGKGRMRKCAAQRRVPKGEVLTHHAPLRHRVEVVVGVPEVVDEDL